MRALVLRQMDQISRWAGLQDDLQASFEQSTNVIRQQNESNAMPRDEHDPLRVKIVGSAEQQEQTTALFKRTDVIVEKLMDENAMLCIKCRRLVEESVAALNQHLEDKKELIAAHRGD